MPKLIPLSPSIANQLQCSFLLLPFFALREAKRTFSVREVLAAPEGQVTNSSSLSSNKKTMNLRMGASCYSCADNCVGRGLFKGEGRVKFDTG